MTLRERILNILPNFISKRFQSAAKPKLSSEFDISAVGSSETNNEEGTRKTGAVVIPRTPNPTMEDLTPGQRVNSPANATSATPALKSAEPSAAASTTTLFEPSSDSHSARSSQSSSVQRSSQSSTPREANISPPIQTVAEFKESVAHLKAITEAIKSPKTSPREVEILNQEGSQICKSLRSASKKLSNIDEGLPQTDRIQYINARSQFDTAVKDKLRAAPAAPQLRR